jgi:threonyl-tRNA synthetase
VITLNVDPALLDYANPILSKLRAGMVRAEADFGSEPVKAKIAAAEKARVHTMLVIGHRDVEGGQVSVRLHGQGNVGAKSSSEVVADILENIRLRA